MHREITTPRKQLPSTCCPPLKWADDAFIIRLKKKKKLTVQRVSVPMRGIWHLIEAFIKLTPAVL